jgi:uncharacterized membrane protein
VARTVLFACLTVAYPLGIWLLNGSLQPKHLAVVLALVGAMRLSVGGKGTWRWLGLVAFALAGWAALTNQAWPLRWYPVAVNAFLLALFGVSLVSGQSLVERLARLKQPHLPPHAVAYTRAVTQVWCLFFVLNGSIAAATVLFGTEAQWALYNGAVAYGLMGLVAGVEYCVRRRVQARLEPR